MSYDSQNIFAKILRAENPCNKVYEDDATLAFMDIMPQAPGHTIVIPKEPAMTLFDLSGAGAANLIQVVQRVAAAVKQAMQAEGIMLMQLNGAAAGQTVDHIHFHIIPGSMHNLGKHASSGNVADDLAALAEKISACLT
ncbi:MAG: HIT family protein [Proteobacteria bacterium]|nr:HIT family protein [Pseudomonadota bacterium]